VSRTPSAWRTAMMIAVVTSVADVTAFAVNAASGQSRWPGWFDLVRRHPWPIVAILSTAGLILAVITALSANDSRERDSGETEDRSVRNHAPVGVQINNADIRGNVILGDTALGIRDSSSRDQQA
jgi:hypothetical protein